MDTRTLGVCVSGTDRRVICLTPASPRRALDLGQHALMGYHFTADRAIPGGVCAIGCCLFGALVRGASLRHVLLGTLYGVRTFLALVLMETSLCIAGRVGGC